MNVWLHCYMQKTWLIACPIPYTLYNHGGVFTNKIIYTVLGFSSYSAFIGAIVFLLKHAHLLNFSIFVFFLCKYIVNYVVYAYMVLTVEC